jgi:hypothetical protein
MPENTLPPPPPDPRPEPPAATPPPLPPIPPPIPEVPPDDGGEQIFSSRSPRRGWRLPEEWRNWRIPKPWRKPLLVGGLALLAIVFGLMVGRSAFRVPDAPTFEPLEEEEAPLAVEANQETTIEIPVAPPELGLPADPPQGGEIDATDYGLLARLQGEWEIDLGQRGEVRVKLTNQVASQHSQGGYLVRIYRCESRQLPSRFSLVRVPDGGNFIAFHGKQGETRDVFENIEVSHRDLFSFTEATTGRRRYGRRVGSAAAPPSPVAEDAGQAPPEEAPTWEAPAPVAGEEYADEDEDSYDEDEDRDNEVENLWKIARSQRAAKQYGPLMRTLERLLEVSPRHPGARRWMAEVQQLLRDQNKEGLRRTQSLLDDFASAVESRNLDRLRELWGGRFDGESSRFFTQLIRNSSRLDVRAVLVSVTVDGKSTTGFVASVTIESKERGRRAEVQEYSWHGRLKDGRFASPFP